jgi:hypothetical protein
MIRDERDPYVQAYKMGSEGKFLSFGDTTSISLILKILMGIFSVA